METKNKKDFDAVNFMRRQRRILSDKLAKMSSAEIVAYFKQKQLLNEVRPSV